MIAESTLESNQNYLRGRKAIFRFWATEQDIDANGCTWVKDSSYEIWLNLKYSKKKVCNVMKQVIFGFVVKKVTQRV